MEKLLIFVIITSLGVNMGVFEWHSGEVPENLKIKQVYGILFSTDGRVLLKCEVKQEGKCYSLAGGKPEPFDDGMEGTLRREVLEEVNCTIKEPILVGYQEVNEGNGIPPYAQVRMTAIIDKIGKLQPDPDNGETYERLLTPPQRAIELLNWGKEGRLQIEEAVRVIKENYKTELKNLKDELV